MDDGHQPDVGGFNPLNGLYFRDSNCLVQYFQLFIRRFQHSRLHHIVPLPLPLVLQSSSPVFSLPNLCPNWNLAKKIISVNHLFN